MAHASEVVNFAPEIPEEPLTKIQEPESPELPVPRQSFVDPFAPLPEGAIKYGWYSFSGLRPSTVYEAHVVVRDDATSCVRLSALDGHRTFWRGFL